VFINALSPIIVTLLGIVIEVKLVQFLKVSLPISVKLLGDSNVTVVKAAHPKNAPSTEPPSHPFIVVTLFGMVMDVKDVQPRNAPPSIVVTLFGMMIEVKLVQFANEFLPIILRLLGVSNITEVKLVRFANADDPIVVTLPGIVMDAKDVPTNILSPIVVRLLGDSNITEVKAVQPKNAPSTLKPPEIPAPIIVVTLLGIVIEVKLVQPWNAAAPIVVRLLGDSNVMVVRLVQPQNI
jgi:xanthosine utilization system XapX-like protein